MDIRAESTYDAAHLYVSTAKSHAAAMLPSSMPVPTLTSVFEVVVDGKVYTVKGAALQRWIIKQRGGEEGTEGISIFAASDSRLSASQAFAFGFAAAFPSAAGTMPFL